MPVTAHILVKAQGIEEAGRSFDRLERKVSGLGKARRTFEKKLGEGGVAGSQLGALYAAAGGTGIIAGAQRVLDFKSALGQLQVESRLSTEEMKVLEEEILSLSEKGGGTKESLLEALSVFQGYGGILRFGRDMMADMANIAKATGAPMGELATIASSLYKTLGLSKDEIVEAFGAMKAMSMTGTLTLAQVAPDLPQLLGLGKGFGFTGMRGVRQLGAAQQVVGELLPSSAESRTAMSGLFRNLVQSSSKLAARGVRVFDKAGNMRDLDVLMLEILKKTKGKIQGPSGLAKIFNDEGQKAALAFLSSFDVTTGSWKAGSNVEAIFASGRTGSASDIRADAKARSEGIAREAAIVKRTLASFDAALMRHGTLALQWAAEDVSRTVATGIGIAGGARIAMAGLSALGAAAGTTAGPILAAAGLGYAFGNLVLDADKAGEAIADFVFSILHPEEHARREKAQAEAELPFKGLMTGGGTMQTDLFQRVAQVQAAALAVGVTRGKTGSGFEREMRKAGAAAGLEKGDIAVLLPELKRIASAVEKAPRVKVEVKGAGIDKAKAQADRGREWLRE